MLTEIDIETMSISERHALIEGWKSEIEDSLQIIRECSSKIAGLVEASKAHDQNDKEQVSDPADRLSYLNIC